MTAPELSVFMKKCLGVDVVVKESEFTRAAWYDMYSTARRLESVRRRRGFGNGNKCAGHLFSVHGSEIARSIERFRPDFTLKNAGPRPWCRLP